MFAKIEFISVYLAVIFVVFSSSIESWAPDCNLNATSSKAQIDIYPQDRYMNIEALNLNIVNRTYSSCSWNIYQKKAGNTFLELTRVILDSNDTVIVFGQSDKINDTLFQGSGSTVPGLISTAGYTNVIVQLKLSNETQITRIYSSAIYWDADYVRLSMDSGVLSFPLNNNPKINSTSKSITNQFTLQPSSEYSDRVILLNFLGIHQNASFALDGVEYNRTNPPPSIYLKNDPSPLRFVLVDYEAPEPILVRYWLVTADCSGIVNLKLGQQAPIPIPIETDNREEQRITEVKCAQHFIGPENSKFQLLIDSNTKGLANPCDLVNFYRKDGSLELGLTSATFSQQQHKTTVDTYLSQSSYLVVYDSPTEAENPNPQFVAPKLLSIPSTQAQTFTVSPNNPVPVVVNGAAKTSQTVHQLYASEPNSIVFLNFDNVTLKPGQGQISIYNTDDTSAAPIVQLGQFDRLPSVIPSNTGVMRVVYSGVIPSIKITYRTANSKACIYLASVTPNFEVRSNANSICSWYIPESKTEKTVINPTIMRIPEGNSLTVRIFTKDNGFHTETFKGPLNSYYLPDMFLNSAHAYEFVVDASTGKDNDLHLLIAKKNNYLNENILFEDSKVPSISSANYPGLYPVGVKQEWTFNGKNQNWALVTIEDVRLTDLHNLTLDSKESGNQTWSGDVDLTAVPDYLVQYPFSFGLDTEAYDLSALSNRGFRVKLQYPDFGQDLTFKDSHDISFTSQNVNKKFLNIWKVTAEDSSASLSDTILRIKVTSGQSLNGTVKLSIFDSISMRTETVHSANLVNGTESTYLGSIKSALIVYETLTAPSNGSFSINFAITAEKCSNNNYHTKKCKTVDRCITDAMVCNGKNDCGDFTDELYCDGYHPLPSPVHSGVSVVVVIFVLMPIGALLGILGYVLIPRGWRRFRAGPGGYSELSEVS